MAALAARFLLLSLWGGAAAVAVLAVTALLRRAHTPSRWLCWLWLAVGVRFAAPWGIPLALPRPADPQLAQAAEAVQDLAQAPAQPLAAAPLPAAQAAAPWYTQLTLWHGLAALWAAGVVVLAVRAVWGYAHLRRTVALACKTPQGYYTGACVPAPFTLGLLRPKIYLPTGLNAAARSAVLLHERTHIRRGDTLTKPLFYAVVCLHWFNPLAWLAFAQFERTMESACDEAAVRGQDTAARSRYCECILQFALQGRMAPGSLAFGQGSAKARIVHLLRYRRLGAGALALCAVAVGLCATACMVRPTVAQAPATPAQPVAAATAAQPAPVATAETAANTNAAVQLPALAELGGYFPCPVAYDYISRFVSGAHRGDDLCAARGTAITAQGQGTVLAAGYHTSYGNYADILYGYTAEGYAVRLLYAHLDALTVAQGDAVAPGQTLGTVGSSGNSSGNHLHLELYLNSTLMDPRYFVAYPRPGDALPLTDEKLAEIRAELADDANAAALLFPLERYDRLTATFAEHGALDIAAATGTPVYACADGTVTEAGYDTEKGNYAVLQHSSGLISAYHHLGMLTVATGQTVTQGQQLGTVGSTGSSTGPHLHWELRQDGAAIDPLTCMAALPTKAEEALAEQEEVQQQLQQEQQQEQQARQQLAQQEKEEKEYEQQLAALREVSGT